MPINRHNQKVFHRRLYAGQLTTILLQKRSVRSIETQFLEEPDTFGQDPNAITRTNYTLYQCRRSSMIKTGQTLQYDMAAEHRCTWYIPRSELDRVGINHINSLDRIVHDGKHWQPESTTSIAQKVFDTHLTINCLRIDPPGAVN